MKIKSKKTEKIEYKVTLSAEELDLIKCALGCYKWTEAERAGFARDKVWQMFRAFKNEVE